MRERKVFVVIRNILIVGAVVGFITVTVNGLGINFLTMFPAIVFLVLALIAHLISYIE